MTRTADLLTVLYDIDAYRGRVCRSCTHYERRADGGYCHMLHDPAPGGDDTCHDWAPQVRVLKHLKDMDSKTSRNVLK